MIDGLLVLMEGIRAGSLFVELLKYTQLVFSHYSSRHADHHRLHPDPEDELLPGHGGHGGAGRTSAAHLEK